MMLGSVLCDKRRAAVSYNAYMLKVQAATAVQPIDFCSKKMHMYGQSGFT